MIALTAQENFALDAFKKRVLARFASDVMSFTLFGSRARGEGDSASDLDVLVITRDESRQRRDEILDIANDVLLEFEIDISPLVIGKKRYDSILAREWLIGKEIQRDGRPL